MRRMAWIDWERVKNQARKKWYGKKLEEERDEGYCLLDLKEFAEVLYTSVVPTDKDKYKSEAGVHKDDLWNLP